MTPLTKDQQPLVSVVLLSHARPEYLSEALPSLLSQSYRNLELLVVDNRSSESAQIANIVGRHPSVRLIANPDNSGFTGGMNLGIQAATGRYIHLTEDDVILDRDCISSLVAYAAATPSAGLLSGVLYNKRKGTICLAGARVTLGSVYQMDVFGQGQDDRGQFRQPFDVDYITGAMMFSSLELWRELGGFRDDFFMYYEDTELCVRARRRGHRITIVPNAKAHHFERGDKPEPRNITFHKLRNFFALYILHAPLSSLAGFFGRYFLADFLRSLRFDRGRATLLLRAAWSILTRAAQLWKERRSNSAMILAKASSL